jgi:hypothetical protein
MANSEIKRTTINGCSALVVPYEGDTVKVLFDDGETMFVTFNDDKANNTIEESDQKGNE